jgi:hypothetical protein
MKCPNCNSGKIEKANGIFPFNENHLQCNCCDSTYSLEFLNNLKNNLENRKICDYNQFLILKEKYKYLATFETDSCENFLDIKFIFEITNKNLQLDLSDLKLYKNILIKFKIPV